MRFYDCETQEFVTLDELRKNFEADETNLTEYESFEAYVRCTSPHENGTLIPVPDSDEMDEPLYICLETDEIVNRKRRDYMLIHEYGSDEFMLFLDAKAYFIEIPR